MKVTVRPHRIRCRPVRAALCDAAEPSWRAPQSIAPTSTTSKQRAHISANIWHRSRRIVARAPHGDGRHADTNWQRLRCATMPTIGCVYDDGTCGPNTSTSVSSSDEDDDSSAMAHCTRSLWPWRSDRRHQCAQTRRDAHHRAARPSEMRLTSARNTPCGAFASLASTCASLSPAWWQRVCWRRPVEFQHSVASHTATLHDASVHHIVGSCTCSTRSSALEPVPSGFGDDQGQRKRTTW